MKDSQAAFFVHNCQTNGVLEEGLRCGMQSLKKECGSIPGCYKLTRTLRWHPGTWSFLRFSSDRTRVAMNIFLSCLIDMPQYNLI